MIEAGKLNRRLTIYQAVTVRSATGVETTTRQALTTVWAERASLFLREVNRMAGLTDAAEAKFVIRYRTDVQIGAEVACDNSFYTVVSTEEIGNREGLALLVRAI